MNLRKWLVLAVSLLMLTACTVSVGSPLADPVIPRITTDTRWFVDTTGRVSEATLQTLHGEAVQMNQEGFQVAGAFFSDSLSDGMEIATKFGNENGIGDAGKDNGIAIVVFLDKAGGDGNKPSISVAIGSGLESLLNDGKVGRFLDQTFVSARSEGRWEEGLVEFVLLVHDYLKDPLADEFREPPADYTWLLYVLIGLIVFLAIDGVFLKWAISLTVLEILDTASSSSGSNRSGSRSSGGGSRGGGGGFSGGGSSR